MTVKEFAEKNGMRFLSYGDGDLAISGCYIGDLLSLAMSRVEFGNAWLTVQGNVNIAGVAALTEPSCIILVEDRTLDENTEEKAKEQGINILSTELSAYEVACRLYEQCQ